MKLTMRAAAKKVTLITTAFVLAVSALTALAPFMSAKQVSALEVVNGDTAKIYNAADLSDAAANPAVKNFSIKASFTTSVKTVLDRTVNIDGNGNTITFAGTSGWHSEYVFQVYKAQAAVKNLKVTGGDAAFIANGSKLIFQGGVDVSGNEFGGVEVSQGNGVTSPASLAVSGSLANSTEAPGKPTAWIDDASTASATVTGPFTVATHHGTDQKQYYLSAQQTGTVVTNTVKGTTYDNIQTAIDTASNGDTLRLEKSVNLSSMVKVTKPLTFDGNGKTLTATYSYTVNGVDNAVVTVLSSNVTVKNLTTDNTATGQKPHGMVVQNVNGVTLNDVTFKNGRAGLIVNGSVVNVNGIHTSGNEWYGVNVDRAGARLNIQGNNSHTEAAHLVVDHRSSGAYIVDLYNKYEKTVSGDVATYVLDTHAPTVTGVIFGASALDGATIKGSQTVTATLQDAPQLAVNFTNFELRKDGLWKAQWTGGNSLSPSFALNTASYTDGAYSLRVYGRDNAGNTFEKIVNFTIDNTVPSLNVTGPIDSVVSANTLVVTGEVSDQNLYQYKYQILDSNKQNTLGAVGNSRLGGVTNTSGNLFTVDISALGDGVYYISVWASDKAGNATNIAGNRLQPPYIIKFTVDRSGPALTLGNPAYTLVGNTLTPAITSDDDTATYSWAQEGGPAIETTSWDTLTPEITLVASGQYRFTVTATDALGNSSEATVAFTYTLPTTTPTVVAPLTTPTSSEEPQATAVTFPSANGGIATFGVLGTTTPGDDTTQGTEGVEGTSTEKNLAAAVDTDSSDGTVLGMAWYWWLLILAALATLIWWIIAALRNRAAQS